MREQFEITFLNRSESLLAEAGLVAAEQIVDLRGAAPFCPGPGGSLRYLKRLSDGRAAYTSLHRASGPDRAERWVEETLRTFSRLGGEGVGVAEPAAHGSVPSSDGGTRGFVVLLAPAGAVELDDHLRRVPSGTVDLVHGAAIFLAGVHARGIRLCHIPAWNILVLPDRTFSVIDPGGALFGKEDRNSAARDLAALSATIEAATLSTVQRRRFLETYTKEGRSPWDRNAIGTLWRRVSGEERKLRRSGFFPRAIALVEKSSPGARLQVAAEWEAELARFGFNVAADFAAPSGVNVECVREKEDRRNYVVGDGKRRYYLKVHGGAKGCESPSPGAREWQNNLRLLRYGIPVAAITAWGEDDNSSFFASRDRGGIPLNDWLRAVSSGPRRSIADGERGRTGRLARAAGCLVRAFHKAGFFHRDLYLCHILLEEGRLLFIDLQRLEEGYIFKRRGRIKDLAALLYSSMATPVTDKDRLRFLAAYLGGGRLKPAARRLIAAVRRKASRIARHDAKSRRTSKRRNATHGEGR